MAQNNDILRRYIIELQPMILNVPKNEYDTEINLLDINLPYAISLNG